MPHRPWRCLPAVCQARFQGQFLKDEDVGQRAAPKRKGLDAAGPSSALGRDASAAQQPHQSSVRDGDPESLASRRKRLGLGERPGQPGPEAAAGGAAMLEIRPKRRLQPMTESAPSEQPLLEIKSRNAQRGDESAKPALGQQASRPKSDQGASLQLSAGEGISDDEFAQSLRLRAKQEYIHPSVMPALLAQQQQQQQRGPIGMEQASGAEPDEVVEQPLDDAEAARTADHGGSGDEDALSVPVSTVSVGLLRGVARRSERDRLEVAAASQAVVASSGVAPMPQTSAGEPVAEVPGAVSVLAGAGTEIAVKPSMAAASSVPCTNDIVKPRAVAAAEEGGPLSRFQRRPTPRN